MERKRSFIMRLFTTLFALLLAILTVAGFGIYVYARQVVGEEFIRLNQANLQQVASNTGSALMEALTLGKQIAVNSRLLALSELPQEEARKKPEYTERPRDRVQCHPYEQPLANGCVCAGF